jgi:hypothetical protein
VGRPSAGPQGTRSRSSLGILMDSLYVEGFVEGWEAKAQGKPLDDMGAPPSSRTSYVEGYIDGYEAQGTCGSSHPLDELNFRSYCTANGL